MTTNPTDKRGEGRKGWTFPRLLERGREVVFWLSQELAEHWSAPYHEEAPVCIHVFTPEELKAFAEEVWEECETQIIGSGSANFKRFWAERMEGKDG